MKAVVDTTFSGPVKVKLLSKYRDPFSKTWKVECRVTERTHPAYAVGDTFDFPIEGIFLTHKFKGFHSYYSGRPDFSTLPNTTI